MNISADLKFEEIENGPELICHWCSGKVPQPIWQMADVEAFVEESAHISIIVCSDACRIKLINYEFIDEALVNMFMHISIKTGETLKDSYLDYLLEIEAKKI